MIRSHAKPLVKYGLVGIVFTSIGPLLFLALNAFLPRVVSILISEPILYSLKFLIYKNWVYKDKNVGIVSYLLHVLPLYFISFVLISITQSSLTSLQAILLVVVVNGLLAIFGGIFFILWLGKRLYSLYCLFLPHLVSQILAPPIVATSRASNRWTSSCLRICLPSCH